MRPTKPKRFGVIYVFTNAVNGKQYVGQTVAKDPDKYCKGHIRDSRYGSKKAFHAAIRKHGERNFTFEIVLSCFDKAALDYAEDHFITELDTLAPNGYNIKTGGANGRLPPNICIQISNKLKGYRWINNGKTDRLLKSMEVVPTGWTFGRLNFDSKWNPDSRANHQAALDDPITKAKMSVSAVGKRWINNGSESRRLHQNDSLPQGWHYGRIRSTVPIGATGFRWITNGIEITMVPRDAPLPSGWRYGIINEKRVGRNVRTGQWRWITNGSTNAMITLGSCLPLGWHFGITRIGNAGKRWITDGTSDALIDLEKPLPIGWCVGRTCANRTVL